MGEFHWKNAIFFRRNDLGEVEIVSRPKMAAYWTVDKGFHDPETPVLTIDAGSWDSIVAFLGKEPAAPPTSAVLTEEKK